MSHTEETKQKISAALKGKRVGEANPQYGKPHSEETKRKISETKKSQHRHTILSEEARNKISLANKGENHHQYGKPISKETKLKLSNAMKGKKRPPRSKEWCDKIAAAHIGKKHSEETKIKMSNAQLGEKAKLWKGGLSYGKYCKKFRPVKKRVRAWFGNTCVLCGEPPLKEQLIVHHCDYNKNTCCDNNRPLFVTLCRSCHGETNSNREYWESLFVKWIDSYYGGKCFLTREEYVSLYK
jgi:hypothetical protein